MGDFEDWVSHGLRVDCGLVRVPEARRIRSREHAGVVVTGSYDMISGRAAWSEQVAAWMREAVALEVTILDIYYGH